MRRATGQRRHAEAAGIAIAVKHPLRLQALHNLRKTLAAVTLVKVVAGLMPLRNVQTELPAMLAQDQRCIALAAHPTDAGIQPFETAAAGVRAFIDFLQAGVRDQGIGNCVFPALATCAAELRHQGIAIAVHDQAGQAVGLAVHQAQAIASYRQSRACIKRGANARSEKSGVNAIAFLKTPDACANARLRAKGRPA